MFTGIVEELGTVKKIVIKGTGTSLTIGSDLCSAGSKIGESIAVNGCCLTITEVNNKALVFDVSSETIEKSNLKSLDQHNKVNLERSLRADSRLGGHFVTGHIDCTGEIISSRQKGNFVELDIKIPDKFISFIAEKGSVSVDGISLTVNTVCSDIFKVMIIPHTLSVTTLKDKISNGCVNIETDILAKYVINLSNNRIKSAQKRPSITKDFLMDRGFF